MTTLKFADTYNMVAFLAKPAESEGFEQIVDFLNTHSIKHALTVNPTIYTSCIEQFWATVKAKTINGEVQLQALVDGNKIVITKSIVRRDLQLEDVDGANCLPNATIFEQLTLMGAKNTAWNEFSSTMASVIICLATNQKFNFSKYIFESMVKNLDNVGKFLMYPRSRRPKRKDTQVLQSSVPSDNVAYEAVNEEMDDSLVRAATTASSLESEQDCGNIDKTQSKATPNEPSSPGTSSGGGPRCQETMGDTIAQTRSKNVSKLSNDPLLARVLALKTIKTTQSTEITSLKRRVKKLEKRNKSRTHMLKRLYKVGLSRRVESSDEEGLGKDNASKQGRISNIDDDAKITLVITHFDADTEVAGISDAATTVSVVSEIPTVTAANELTLAQALAELKSARPPTQGISFREPKPVVEKDKLIKKQEHMRINEELTFKLQAEEEEEERTELVEESSKKAEAEIAHESNLKREGEELKQESSKKQKLEEDKESEELKQCLEIVPDDVTIDATLLSTKSLTIIDYKIYKEGKKSYFQIIRADVKARFKNTEPVNYMDNFLLLNLKTMFEYHVKDSVWKNQQGLVKVMNWKLYDSCGVHYVTMQNMLLYLLVEKIYPLTNHTLYQIFNDVKLQVDYECEMAFELLRLVKKQLKEYYVPK
ncbi:hypothetical protein Tco_0450955 [Tanacetum coccineum]